MPPRVVACVHSPTGPSGASDPLSSGPLDLDKASSPFCCGLRSCQVLGAGCLDSSAPHGFHCCEPAIMPKTRACLGICSDLKMTLMSPCSALLGRWRPACLECTPDCSTDVICYMAPNDLPQYLPPAATGFIFSRFIPHCLLKSQRCFCSSDL